MILGYEGMESNKGILILSGYNQRAIVSFCRFAKSCHLEFYIVADDKYDFILISDFKDYAIAIRDSKDLKLEDFDKWKEITGKDELFILPSTEYLNRFILQNRKYLEDKNFIIPLCDEKTYYTISDKYSFFKLCESQGIDIPAEYITLKYPCVAKPRRYSSVTGLILKPEILWSEKQFNKFFETHQTDDFYFQEFVQGKSIYLLFYFSTTGEVFSFSQENLMQQANGLSIIAARSSNYHSNGISAKYQKMLSRLRFHGLIMIEVKLSNNDFYMIEANPRLWGPSQLILDSGMDLFHRYMADYGFLENTLSYDSYKTGVKYFWSGGITADSKDGLDIIFHGDYAPQKFMREYYDFFSSEIYLKHDTINIFIKENGQVSDSAVLADLYNRISKHSQYQKIPAVLKPYVNDDTLSIKSRHEDERFAYITKNVEIENKKILDIGANTGYFSFELIKAGARCVHIYEGNKDHADFIRHAADFVHLNKRILVRNEYFDFSNRLV